MDSSGRTKNDITLRLPMTKNQLRTKFVQVDAGAILAANRRSFEGEGGRMEDSMAYNVLLVFRAPF
jgi:hypothetical protein